MESNLPKGNAGLKKTAAIGTVALVILAGAIGAIQYGKSNQDNSPVTSTGTIDAGSREAQEATGSLEEQRTRLIEADSKRHDLYNLAVNNADESICAGIEGDDKLKQECVDNALLAKAASSEDPTFCEKVSDATLKSKCTNDFVFKSAVKASSQADCENIQGDDALKYACKKNVVFASIESESFTGTVETACAGLEGADLDYCKGRIEKGGDIVVSQKAIDTKDPTLCAKVTTEAIRNNCNDVVYTTLAVEKSDISLCGKIIDWAKKQSCSTSLMKVADAQTFQQANESGNIALCSKIATPDLKTKCNDTLTLKAAIANVSSATCAKIVDPATKEQCVSTIDSINKAKASTTK